MSVRVWLMLAAVVYLIQQYDPWLAKFVTIYACFAAMGWGLAKLMIVLSYNKKEG